MHAPATSPAQAREDPRSKDILAFSMIHLPSLYFWLSSKASTYFQPIVRMPRGLLRLVALHGAGGQDHGRDVRTEDSLARVAVDVSDCVQTSDEVAVLLGP